MPSPESQALSDLYKTIRSRLIQYSDLDAWWIRLILESLADAAAEPSNVTYEEVQCPGTNRPALWVKPTSTASTSVILYLHGGAGFAGSPSSHRKYVGHLAKATGCIILLLDYRLAPEHPFPAGIEDVVLAYDWILEKYSPENTAIAGDSAGGNIAISTVLKLKDGQRKLPAAVMVFSPWLDMELSGESMTSNLKTDALTGRESLEMSIGMYLAGHSPKDPYANPLYGNLKGFPPLYVSVGTWEVLLSDSVTLVKLAKDAGVDVTEDLADEMQHDYILMAGRAPEADKTINAVGKWLRQRLAIV